MKYIFLVLALIVLSCASGGKILTQEEFCQITVGMTSSEVEKKYGKPFSIRDLGNSEIEYKYIEKVTIGKARVIQEKYYIIIFKNGRVTSTKTQIFNRPVYERNSYEMQTSYN